MLLLITIAIFCSNNVESRNLREKLEGLSASRLQYVPIGDDQINGDSSNEDDREAYMHTKRKSELLSSLYGLPYALVHGKRKAN
ncbi:unnamed protein product [Adineta steineri]|uniref:Uncharacterized protein n=1 Tax=Adineta steineri TaxID=433720 RepID=A0A813SQD6_9BILA|nr:unnamed protein product [Adineta steineri]CAF1334290.1 unnamed protein product [Adineta steineri]